MKLLQSGLPCPHVSSCGSSDAVALYLNENENTGEPVEMYHCFSCGRSGSLTEKVEEFFETEGYNPHFVPEGRPPRGLTFPGQYTSLDDSETPWGYRGLSKATCSIYNMTVRLDKDGPNLIFPYYVAKKGGKLVAQKVRTLLNPKGTWLRDDSVKIEDIGFFGQQAFPSPTPRHKSLAITFGEFDAPSVYQMLNGQPAVSVPHGDQSSLEFFKKEFNYLNQWSELVLIPDNDDKCRKIIPSLVQMFPRKAKVVTLTEHKDPNDYLKYGDIELFKTHYFQAKALEVDKIRSLADVMAEHLLAEPPKPMVSYPFAKMNELLGGIYPSDIIVIKAPPGVGKTTFTSTVAHHIIETSREWERPLRVGLIFLEETMGDLAFRFATLELKVNMQDPTQQKLVDKEKLNAVLEKRLHDDRIFVVDHGDTCSTDFLEEKFKELVFAKGCDVLLFDHISMAIADDSNEDERKALDKALYTMRSLLTKGLVETLPNGTEQTFHPALIVVTHTNKNGDPRGSMAAKQVGNVMLSLKRDPDELDDVKRNMMLVWVEKNRRLGRTGIGAFLYYNNITGCLEDRTQMVIEEGSDINLEKYK